MIAAVKRIIDFLLSRWYVTRANYESVRFWSDVIAGWASATQKDLDRVNREMSALQKEYREKTSEVAMDEVRKILREERDNQNTGMLSDAATMAANHVAHGFTQL